jgi:hypothetical protein
VEIKKIGLKIGGRGGRGDLWFFLFFFVEL